MKSDYLDGYDDGRRIGRLEFTIAAVVIAFLAFLIFLFTRATP
jgi:hypothetical protein